MCACPTRLELSRCEAEPESERPAELLLHVATCKGCEAVLADLADARFVLLGANPGEASLRAARAIAEVARGRRRTQRLWRFLLPGVLVPSMAALLLFVVPGLAARRSNGISGTMANTIKGTGALQVEMYCKRGEEIFLATDGADFLEGDRLRFAYTKNKSGVLLVFGVDDDGKIFPYYQEHELVGMAAPAGAQVLLPDSIELDGHKGWERVYLVWSDGPLAEDAVRSAAASALSAAEGDVRRTTALDLPGEQVSFLLRRP